MTTATFVFLQGCRLPLDSSWIDRDYRLVRSLDSSDPDSAEFSADAVQHGARLCSMRFGFSLVDERSITNHANRGSVVARPFWGC